MWRKKTEPYYFDKFKVSSAEIKIEGTGKNTKSLVQHAISLRKDVEEYAKNLVQNINMKRHGAFLIEILSYCKCGKCF